MLPEPEICERARQSRDVRFDGRFFVGVLTTGIYCRPVCPARMPAEDNVRYYATPASAQDAGFRPCLRCRPETARRLPEWTVGSQTVVRGMRMIDAGFLDERSVDDLAATLSISARHLNRLFLTELDATPKSLARVRRLHLAKRLIDQSGLSFASVAMRAGYGSVRRFNDEIRATYGRSPRSLRSARGAPAPADSDLLTLQLPVREPYHADWVFGFLKQRALPGLEEVQDLRYRRRLFADGDEIGWLQVQWVSGGLRVDVPLAAVVDVGGLLSRVRHVFDLDADPQIINDVLGADELLAPQVAADPGLRVPGAWDGFETAVRAILGQQVSVARATVLAGKLCQLYGNGAFPNPTQLVEADVAEIGMPGARGEAIRLLAAAVINADLVLDESAEQTELTRQLCEIPGIGPWTAGYVCMRVARDPDAFPDSDWVVLKVLEATPAGARKRARAWQPWRAYAVMYLWRIAQVRRARSGKLAGKLAG